ncbi:MAG: c-type cytochrome [Verrucomicrobiota bacterium]|jgi:mono/diheme cytochrome c family protein
MRYFLTLYILAIVAFIGIAGFRGEITRKPPIEVFPDMDRQMKLRPQEPNRFFGNQRSSQPYVEGTIARGMPYQDIPVNTGRISGSTNWVEVSPIEITEAVMSRGRERYNISCAPCHGAAGDGKGITTKYGMVAVANFHDARLVEMADGEIFNTITHGKNLMGSYGANIKIEDRWAIIAYLRALQRSRLSKMDDVPEPQQAALQN